MELKTYTPVSLKHVFQKLEFKVLHYIPHDSICQRPGLSNHQTSMLENLVINYFIRPFGYLGIGISASALALTSASPSTLEKKNFFCLVKFLFLPFEVYYEENIHDEVQEF